jgi:1,4-alpha-glucan branching enzyme
MTPVARQYRLGLPAKGRWLEILNTDAAVYGGSNAGNQGGVVSEDVPWQGQAQSALVTLPALSALYLKQE